MQTETTKSAHLNIRISELSKNVLQRAAEFEGKSLSHFVLSQALEGAHALFSQTQTLSLSPQDQMLFLQFLENPMRINERLSMAIERYKKVKKSGSEV